MQYFRKQESLKIGYIVLDKELAKSSFNLKDKELILLEVGDYIEA